MQWAHPCCVLLWLYCWKGVHTGFWLAQTFRPVMFSLRFSRDNKPGIGVPYSYLRWMQGFICLSGWRGRMITKNIFFCDLVWLLLHTKKLRWRFNSKTRCAVPLPKINMMSAIDTGTSVYQPAKLLNWLYTSLHDTQQTNTFDAFRTESESSPRDRNNKQRSAAAVDLSTALNSNYLINFVQLQRNEV